MPRIRETEALPDPELMAYVDGALPPEEMAQVQARIMADPELRVRVDAWTRQRDLIAAAARAADERPVDLRIVALERELARRLQKRRWRMALHAPRLRQIAASLVIFAAGWGTHAMVQSSGTMLASAYPGYVEAALLTHSAEARPVATQVSFGSDEIEAALAWMSEQMQLQIDSPRLDRLGYQVISARLDTSGTLPVAHFIYRDTEGETVTVSVAPHPRGTPAIPLRVTRAGSQALAYWSDGAYDYSVVAATDLGMMTTLAAAVRN